MSISANYPTVAPSLNLDFANSQQLDPRITFSRPTTAAYYDANTTALAEQNLFLQSQAIGTSGWGLVGVTATLNTTVAPDGTTTGSTITGTGGGSALRYLSQGSLSATSSVGKTISIYAKAGTNNYIQFYYGGDANVYANFDISTGVLGTVGSTATASITSVGSGWYRCVMITSSTIVTDPYIGLISTATSARAESNTLATTYFAWGIQLEQRSTVTAYNATTTTAITNYIPVLLTAPTNQARFDHDPVARTSLGLLIEQQSTNLLTYSSDYTNAVWTKTGSSITATADVAPDGTQTASLLTETTATSAHVIQNTATISAGTYTFSVYAKQGFGSRYLAVYPQATSVASVVYNLTTGVATQTGGAGYLSNSITAVGNGWYRCSVTWSATGTTAYCALFLSNSSTSPAPSYTGDGWSGVYIWGAQLEALAFPTSYIPTVASQVTRSADNASMTGTNFSSWYQSNQGSFYSEADIVSPAAGSLLHYVFTVVDSTNTNTRNYLVVNALGFPQFVVRPNNTVSFNATSSSIAVTNTSFKFAGYAQVNNFGAAFSSSTVQTGTSGAISPTVNQILFGIDNAGGQMLNGHIRKFAYYPVAVTSSNLTALTGS